jgi:hypothetical protein
MAFQAAGSFLFRVVKMMIPAAILFCQVATVTKSIAMYENLSAVRFMTIFTDHAVLIHFTLQKGGIDIDLLEYLAISEIESLIKQRRAMRFQE